MKVGTLHEVVCQEEFLDSLKSAGQSLIQKGKEAGQNLIQKGATKVHNTLYNNSSAYRAGFQQARQNMVPQQQQAANVARRVVPTAQKPTIQPPKPAPVVQKPVQQPIQQPVVQKTKPNVVNGRLQQPALNRPKLNANAATDPKTGITFSKQNGKLVSNAMQPQQPVQQQQQAQKAPSVTDPKTGVTYSKNPNGQYTATTKEYISPNGTVVNIGNGQVQKPNTPQQQPAPAKPISVQDPKTGITYTKHPDGTYTSTEKSYYYTKPGERYSSAYTHPDGSISVRDNQTGDIYTKKNGQYTITSTKPQQQQSKPGVLGSLANAVGKATKGAAGAFVDTMKNTNLSSQPKQQPQPKSSLFKDITQGEFEKIKSGLGSNVHSIGSAGGASGFKDTKTGNLYFQNADGKYFMMTPQKPEGKKINGVWHSPEAAKAVENGTFGKTSTLDRVKSAAGSIANVVGKAGKALKDHVSGDAAKNAALRNALMQDQQKLQQYLQNR